jgi:hypothetical protein
LDVYPEVEFLDHVCLILGGTSMLFSTAVTPFSILSNSAHSFQSLIP